MQQHVDFYKGNVSRIITADYGLYWWDYRAGYDSILAEFVGNQSKQRHLALCRGAATTFSKDWGAIITWEHNVAPFIESDTALYVDMVNAYKAGAKYVIIFDAPKLNTYGILTENHLGKLQQFWNYVQDNPQDFGSQKATAAYVMPKDYGFGLRRPDDRIWGLFPPDELSPKIWNDTNKLVKQYGFGFDIIFDEPGVLDAAKIRYENLFFWNATLPFS